jgi:hypothetical protein
LLIGVEPQLICEIRHDKKFSINCGSTPINLAL